MQIVGLLRFFAAGCVRIVCFNVDYSNALPLNSKSGLRMIATPTYPLRDLSEQYHLVHGASRTQQPARFKKCNADN